MAASVNYAVDIGFDVQLTILSKILSGRPPVQPRPFRLECCTWFRLVIVAFSLGIMPIWGGASTYPPCSDSLRHLSMQLRRVLCLGRGIRALAKVQRDFSHRVPTGLQGLLSR